MLAAFLPHLFLWIAAPIFLGVCWLAHELIDGELGKRLAASIPWNAFWQAVKENVRYGIIALTIIIAVSIHACSTRYYSVGNNRILDRWTGKIVKP